jgi:hypothetical protein
MDDDDDFEMKIWEDFKTKSYKSKNGFTKGASYCKLKPREKAIHHLHHLYSQMYSLNEKSTQLKQELLNENLLVAQPSNSDTLIIRNSSNAVHFSMNKKKRWLLLDILKQKCKESEFESNENKTLLKTFIFPKSMRHSTREKCRYFDNNKHFFDKMVNFDTAENVDRAKKRKRTHRKENNMNKKKKTHFYKRGNLVNIINNQNQIHRNYEELEHIEANRMENQLLEASTIQFDFFISTLQLDHMQRRGFDSKNYFSRLHDRYQRYWGVPTFNRIKAREKNRILKIINTDVKDLNKTDLFDGSKDNHLENSNDWLDLTANLNESLAFSEYFNQKKSSFPNMQIRKLKPIEMTDRVSNHLIFYEKQESGRTKKENSRPNETPKIIEAQSQHQHFLKISLACSDLKSFFISFRDALRLEQVKFSLCRDCTPIKLIIKLDDLIRRRLNPNEQPIEPFDCRTALIFDLVNGTHVSNYFYLSTVASINPESIHELENNSFERLQELIEYVLKMTVEFPQPNHDHHQISKQEPNKSTKNNFSSSLLSFGKLSSMEPNELIKQYEQQLNMNTNSELERKSSIDFFLKELNFLALDNNSKQPTIVKTCEICYDQVEWPCGFFKLNSCSHDEEACLNCWLEYVRIRVMNMKVTAKSEQINCLFDSCEQPIRLELLYTLVPIDLVDKYLRFYTDLRVIRHKDHMTYCKNANCDRIIIARVDDDLISVCTCGSMICNFCLQEAHFPAMCFQAKKYLEDRKKLNQVQISDFGGLATSEGKNCPNCGNYMEKSMGCNHMTCVCGFQFCWLCLKDFYLFHSSMNGYFCSYKPVEVKKYDSHTFIRLNTNIIQMKAELYNILNEQAIINQNSNQFKTKISFEKFKTKLSNDFHRLNLKIYHTKREPQQQEKYIKLLRDALEINQKLDDIKFIFFKLNQVIEYLALLCSASKLYFNINGYSYKINLVKCLRKAVLLRETIIKLINEEQTSCKYDKLNSFFLNTVKFINNLKHFVKNSAKIYAIENI